MKKYLYLTFALCAILFIHCKENENVDNRGVTINKTSIYLSVGETETLVANFIPENTPDKSVTWSSNKKDIATVDATGKITAIKSGAAVITVKTTDGHVNICNVTVRSITVKDKTTLVVGGTETLSLKIADETFITTANETTEKPATGVTWTSSDNTVASVTNIVAGKTTQTGVINALRPGTTDITFTTTTPKGTYTGICKVTVEFTFVIEIKLNKSTTSLTLSTGNVTETLTATIIPTNATYNTVTWSSENPAIATVNPLGVVTAVTTGETKILATAKDGSNITAECTVTVKEVPTIAVTGVTISKSTLFISGNETLQTLTATIEPKDATNQNVTWTSSDPEIVGIIGNGLSGTVNPKQSGTVTITVTTTDGSHSKTCNVTVNYIEAIGISKTSLDLKATGNIEEITHSLSIIAAPVGTTFSEPVTWTSDKPSVATVDTDGVVTAVGAGTAKITATTTFKGEQKKFDCTVTVK